jgi:aminoglycoside phosphotransferase (APT) family kinase protein
MARGTAAKDLDPHHQEAIYDTVRKLIRIPVPKIILADSSSDHDFGRPFTIQERLPGQQLYQMWFHLNHKQKLSIARQLGEYFSQVRHVPYTKGGTIRSTLSNSCAIFEHSFGNPFVVNDPNGDETVLSKSCSTMDLIEARIQRWEELDVDGLFPWHVLFLMLKDADDNHGALKPENSYYLTHNDFHLRNMLSKIIDDTEVKITGILDWEGAEFAPAIVALEPPYYLWQSDTDEDSIDDDVARVLYCKEPIDDKLKEIKQTFDYYAARNLGATPDVSFCTYAYHPEAGFVREAWKWITKGLFDDEDIKRLDHVATHWQKIHKMEEGDGHQGEGVEAWVLVNPKDV